MTDKRQFLTEDKGKIILETHYNTDVYEEHNYQQKKGGKGFTKKSNGSRGNLRLVASVPVEEIIRLELEGCRDAKMALFGSGPESDEALRRLIRKHPEWRSSEGAI